MRWANMFFLVLFAENMEIVGFFILTRFLIKYADSPYAIFNNTHTYSLLANHTWFEYPFEIHTYG